MSDSLSPLAPDRALVAHLTRPAAYTRNWLLTTHQNSSAGKAVYRQVTGLKPAFWPHVVIRKQHNKTGSGAGIVEARFSLDTFEILATVRSDKLGDQAPLTLLEGLHEAIQKDLKSFAPTDTATGRVSRPKVLNHCIERDYPMTGTESVTIYELGIAAKFLSS